MLVLGLALLTGCNKAGDTKLAAADTVATVNGKAISRNTFEFYAKGAAGKPSSELTQEQRAGLLDTLIRGELVAQAYEQDTAKDQEAAAIQDLARLNAMQQISMQRYLKDRKTTEAELRTEYETQIGAISKQEYRARHIVVATEEFARKLVEQLNKGAKFEDLAKKESMDPSKDNGGDLGWFTPERMDKSFADAVAALKKGQVTQNPVQTRFGWHVIKLEDTRDTTPPTFDTPQVKQQLQNIVEAKKFKTYTDGLVKDAKVDKTL
ncbi:MAG: peptidylprolyl isomerase [Steroidobacteraceae bacterium]